MKKVVIIGGSSILLFILALFIAGGYGIYDENRQRCTNDRTSDSVLTEWLVQDKKFDIDAFRKEYRIKEISIDSSVDGHKIPASYIYAKGNRDQTAGTVIMVHGLLGNRLSNYPMARAFLKCGYNVITYDQRSSGGNTAPYTTYGVLESKDTVDCINYAASKVSKENRIGVWGQSMGGATVENAMDEEAFLENVDFAVLDCPMGNMEDLQGPDSVSRNVQCFFAGLFAKVNQGYFYWEQRVGPQIKKADVPVLVVGSKGDKSIPLEMVQYVYDCISNKQKELYLVTDSDHSNIYFEHTSEYEEKVKEFLKRNGD